MTSQRVGAREPSPAAPMPAGPEIALAHKLLFATMQALVSLSIVLPGERLTADRADKGTLVGMSPQMGAEVVSAGESLRA